MMNFPKRVILSRKGFDAGTGCVPSPIFDDGTMFSLPIPDRAGTISYDGLSFGGHNYGKLVLDLKAKQVINGTRMPMSALDRAHLDPDLISSVCGRRIGWKPTFGQCGKDATILRQRKVGVGDLFLFFGWFRRCELVKGVYRFVAGAPDIHVIFGYLRIGEISLLSFDPAPEWAVDHPHLHGSRRKADTRNTLFIAADTLGLPRADNLAGAAAFTRFIPDIQLSAEGMTRSLWRLPHWFYPTAGRSPLSSHEKLGRWQMQDKSCILQSVARGQEFVIDVAQYPEVTDWVADLIRKAML